MKAHYAVYSVPKAAALWCGVEHDQIDAILAQAEQLSQSGSGRGVWVHPDVPCLEPRCRAISEAIESGKLPHGREDGKAVEAEDHVAYERRHILGRNLKSWMESGFPNEKPAFLFDDIERNSHDKITVDAYQSLKADREALKLRVDNSIVEYKKLRSEKEAVEKELLAVKAGLSKFDGMEKQGVSDVLEKNRYWNTLMALATRVISEYPTWREKQRKVQKSGNLQDWLVNDCKANNREAELLKKILSDEYQELN